MTESPGHPVTAVARNRSHRRAAAFLGVVVTIAIVAGCSGSSNGGESASSSGKAAASNGAALPQAAAPARGARPSTPLQPITPLQQRAIVRTATVDLRTRHVDHAADTIVALGAAAGGRVDGDDRTSTGGSRTATLVLRVPPDTLNGVITRVDALGTETSRSVRGQDVTASKADTTARVAALQTSVSRLRGFLSHSGNITSLITLENQLSQRESELESIQGQQRALADEIALATLTVHLSTPPKPAPVKPHPKAAGLGAAFVSGWHALVVTVQWVVKIIGYSLPITAVVVLIGGASLLLWRRRGRGPSVDPAPDPAPLP